jgi:hypothetical protein
MDGIMEIVCPQYYLQANGETAFPQHLEMFKNIITTCVHVDNPRGRNLHLSFLPSFRLGFACSTRLFKLNMIFNVSQTMVEVMTLASNMVNLIIVNPITCM